VLYELTFAGSSEPLRTTDIHPFWVVDHQAWIDAALLKPGTTVLLVDGSTTTIEHIVRKDESATVYNFSVDQLHNYYAGELGVLVHNCGGIYTFIDIKTQLPYIGRTIDLSRRYGEHPYLPILLETLCDIILNGSPSNFVITSISNFRASKGGKI
jgi:hypothetical protein